MAWLRGRELGTESCGEESDNSVIVRLGGSLVWARAHSSGAELCWEESAGENPNGRGDGRARARWGR